METNMYIVKKQSFNTIKYLIAVALVIFAVIPFFWVVSTSFNPASSLLGAHLIPSSFTVNNYRNLLGNTSLFFGKWMLNSLKVSLISVFFIVLLTCTSAYALSRFRFAGKKGVMMGIMILNIFPGILAMLAIFIMMQQIGNYFPVVGLNTHTGLICVYVAGSMSINVLMVKSYIDSISKELDESALIEGATYWQVFWKIILPVIKPMVITVAILAFMSTYGDFIIANLLLKGNDKVTVMVGIYLFTQQRFDINWGIVTAGTVMAAIPVVVLFFASQKYIIGGVMMGAIKE
ncbi:MAG: sugar ABC transporter permease [Spirochaetes bacterium]|nr:sugar ABC transporter permease [Brevinematales bacterium]MCL1959788.1 sugar ABC transporter permease [Spirochaetota bacterium]